MARGWEATSSPLPLGCESDRGIACVSDKVNQADKSRGILPMHKDTNTSELAA